MASWKHFGILAASAALLLVVGCRQDMHNQPKYIPLRASEFFEDGQSARQPVEHTIARGQLKEDAYYQTGKRNNVFANDLPDGLVAGNGKPGRFADLRALLNRGHERYNIYCAPCHSRAGDGNGMLPARGFKKPPSYHEPRLKAAPLGYFYDTMTNGFGAMLNYKAQVPVEDRWAIAAYIRALQLSHDAKLSDVPADQVKSIRGMGTSANMSAQPEPAAPKKEGKH